MLPLALASAGDSLYANGTIVSTDARGASFKAVGVRRGRIVAVGSREVVSRSRRPGFTQVDLHGHTLVPGFDAAHDHFPEAGENAIYQVDLNSPPGGKVLDKDEAIPVPDALRSVTSEAAWQNFEENHRRSIEPGKFADFVILDRNPLTAPHLQLRDLQVLETNIAGEQVSAGPLR